MAAGSGGEPAESGELEPAKPFPIEKILTIGGLEWLMQNEKKYPPGSLDFVGVHDDGLFNNGDDALSAFAKKVPEGALVVTDYRRAASSAQYVNALRYYIQSGTAIVPKAKV